MILLFTLLIFRSFFLYNLRYALPSLAVEVSVLESALVTLKATGLVPQDFTASQLWGDENRIISFK